MNIYIKQKTCIITCVHLLQLTYSPPLTVRGSEDSGCLILCKLQRALRQICDIGLCKYNWLDLTWQLKYRLTQVIQTLMLFVIIYRILTIYCSTFTKCPLSTHVITYRSVLVCKCSLMEKHTCYKSHHMVNKNKHSSNLYVIVFHNLFIIYLDIHFMVYWFIAYVDIHEQYGCWILCKCMLTYYAY